MAKRAAPSLPVSPATKRLSEYMAAARRRKLPAGVAEITKHHILDTLAAIVSGSRLTPGERAISFVRRQGGVKEATVIGAKFQTSAINAALANGIMAHADETDDSHYFSNIHAGSMIVPSALAIAERQGSSGTEFMRAVALGYDVGARTNLVLTYEALRNHLYNSHSFGGTFGAAAAAGVQLGFNARQMRHLLSYAAQQVGGIRSWVRDPEHVEKAFAVGGMAARNGTTAALMIEDGFTGVDDVFSGEPNYFDIYVDNPKRRALTDKLGKLYEVTRTNIKKWSVGSPIQAALDATDALIREHGFTADDIETITATLPKFSARTVDNRAVPNISVQHLIALLVVDGTVTFLSSHDFARMNDAKVKAVHKKIALKGDLVLEKARPPRQAIIEIKPKVGKKVRRHVRAVRGTAANPMNRAEVEAKATDLLTPILGKARTKKLIAAIWTLEKVKTVRSLRKLLTT